MATVLVLLERRAGDLKRASLQAVSVARGLAGDGGRVDALALGSGADGTAAAAGDAGADRLLVAADAALDRYAPEPYTAALAQAAKESGAEIVLLAGTALGKDVAARAAARLETGLLSDVVAIERLASGGLRGRRPIYSGKAFAWEAIPEARPAMATLRPNAFPVASSGKTAEVVALSIPETPVRVVATRLETPPQQELDVAEASVIVSGGRGLKAPEHFSLIRDLAKALGGAVGASRAVVDAGWIPHAHQVGQTGKVVSPGLYVACGISGAIQHLAGMSSSKVIVAINKDADAPIFKAATYGIVGDLFEVLPKLTEEVKKVRAGA
jgi:electron transfer flavoprotein alpha subunit